jgi:transcriptional regulator with XRE-family HTH domain
VDRGHGESAPLGAWLRRARLAAGMSQEELAERAGLSVRAIRDLERGRTRRPYRRTMRLLTDALRIPDADAATLLDLRAGNGPGPPASPADAGPPGVPRQLPAGVRHFVGRVHEQQTLDALLDEAASGGGAVVISAVGGTAGVGKPNPGI